MAHYVRAQYPHFSRSYWLIWARISLKDFQSSGRKLYPLKTAYLLSAYYMLGIIRSSSKFAHLILTITGLWTRIFLSLECVLALLVSWKLLFILQNLAEMVLLVSLHVYLLHKSRWTRISRLSLSDSTVRPFEEKDFVLFYSSYTPHYHTGLITQVFRG